VEDPAPGTAAIVPESVVVAEKAPVAVWWERLAAPTEQWRVVRDGAPVDGLVCGRFWRDQPPALSPDGRHVAYPCFTKDVFGRNEGYVVLDGRRFGPYRNVWGIRLSDDGEHVAYGAADDHPTRPWSFHVDARRLRLRFDEVWRPRLSPDGDRLAWAARRGDRPFVGLDDGIVAAFDDVLWGPRFSQGAVSWVIRRGRKVTRLDATTR
jgi:hypothetical protein